MGQGNQYRYILVDNVKTFPKTYINKLIAGAYTNSLSKVKDKGQIRNGLTITKSISDKKRTLKKRPTKPTKKVVVKRTVNKATKKKK